MAFLLLITAHPVIWIHTHIIQNHGVWIIRVHFDLFIKDRMGRVEKGI